MGCCQSARGSPISSNQTAKPRHTGTFSSASSGHAVDFKIIRRRMNFCMPSSKQVSTTNYCFRYVQVIVPSTLPNLCLFYWLSLHALAIRHCQLSLNVVNSSACVAADRSDCNVAHCMTLLESNSFMYFAGYLQKRLYACHDCSTCHNFVDCDTAAEDTSASASVSVLQGVQSNEQAVCTKCIIYSLY